MQIQHKRKEKGYSGPKGTRVGMGLFSIYLLILGLDFINIYFFNNYYITYYIIPVTLISFVVMANKLLPKIHTVGKIKYKNIIKVFAFNCGVAWLLVHLIIGFIVGFGKSPYDHTIKGMQLNILVMGSGILAREYIRNYLICIFYRKRAYKWLISIAIIMAILQVNLNKFLMIRDIETLTIYFGEQLLPMLSQSVLVSYLSAYGGMWAAIIYLVVTQGFEYFSPLLPQLTWFTRAIIGIGIPLISVTVMITSYPKIVCQKKERVQKKENIISQIVVNILCILFIWFVVGVFTIYPSAIVTGSMKPVIDPGDVILIKKLKSQEEVDKLKIGDVIQFQRNDILVTHRIVDIRENEITHLKEFQTKGDNNSRVDKEWIQIQDIKGTMEMVIPKIGWPTILIKDVKSKNVQDVEF